jgi:hypothetical protein
VRSPFRGVSRATFPLQRQPGKMTASREVVCALFGSCRRWPCLRSGTFGAACKPNSASACFTELQLHCLLNSSSAKIFRPHLDDDGDRVSAAMSHWEVDQGLQFETLPATDEVDAR